MSVLYLDCFSGASGDMLLGASLDLGVPLQIVERAIQQLRLPDTYHLHVRREQRQQIEGVKFDVHVGHQHDCGHAHEHSADHSHGHGHGRDYATIRALLGRSQLSLAVKQRAQAVFHRIAVAEGKIHGVPAEQVHFHEVGALDSIIDIVGFCAAWEYLGRPQILASRLVEGSGFVQCAHGRFPIPTPATLEILRGIPLRQCEEPYEFITPTGAALLAEFAESFGPMPALIVDKIGYGLGTRDTPARPNVVRAVLGQAATDLTPQTVCVLETNLDDCTGEVIGYTQEKLFAAGALDVFTVPIQMKKQRPGVLLTVLCAPELKEKLSEIILTETTAFGLRVTGAERLTLTRESKTIMTPHGEVAVKLGYWQGRLVQAAPEYESCQRLANETGKTLAEIMRSCVESARS
jgi:pyridinium-3,5-bisthiocarboxylic acid mononucleotide nickel chelatase